MDEITIKLNYDQIKRTLNFLGQAPYVEIADIIEAIKLQATEQLNNQENEK